ncbi:hypothetical protein BGX38DRAFT_1145542 [Terfezia claveryi]|nr:hypothetical protein BGX38DRAFT_1145542 [Terfezia claveryi]
MFYQASRRQHGSTVRYQFSLDEHRTRTPTPEDVERVSANTDRPSLVGTRTRAPPQARGGSNRDRAASPQNQGQRQRVGGGSNATPSHPPDRPSPGPGKGKGKGDTTPEHPPKKIHHRQYEHEPWYFTRPQQSTNPA